MQAGMKSNVGFRSITVEDRVQYAEIPVVVLYPTEAPVSTLCFGPYSLEAAPDGPGSGNDLPLVVISHGNNGSPWTLRDLAVTLASSGFVVAMPEHIGNSRSDSSLAGTIANLENRPRHISLAIDAIFASPELASRLTPNSAVVIGMSIGGYSALAAAGGRPSTGPYEVPAGSPRPVQVTRDARIRALVLLAPATAWFANEGSLRDVDIPILIWTGDRDEITPALHAELVTNGVRDGSRVEHRIAPGAGHFSFMSQFPPEMRRSDFPPSQDPPGFDRTALQPYLHSNIVDFLRRALSSTPS